MNNRKSGCNSCRFRKGSSFNFRPFLRLIKRLRSKTYTRAEFVEKYGKLQKEMFLGGKQCVK